MSSSRLNKLYLLSALILLPSCGARLPGSVDVKPSQEPAYNFSQSSKLLSCVGERLEQVDKKPVDVYIADIPDHTVPVIESGFLTKNAVMMVTTAVDRLSTPKVSVIGRNGGLRGHHQIQILGSFTELNRTTSSSALNGQMVLPGGWDVALGTDRNYNHLALDLAMSENNRIVAGTPTSVSIQITGDSGDASITYDDGDEFAVTTALGFTGQEGFHSAQRLLVETSVALMMSKYYKIDIKSCMNGVKREDAMPTESLYDQPVFQDKQLESSAEVARQPQKAVYIDRSGNKSYVPESFVSEQQSYLNNKTVNRPAQYPVQDGYVVLPSSYDPRYLEKTPQAYEIKRGQTTSVFTGKEKNSVVEPVEPAYQPPVERYPEWAE